MRSLDVVSADGVCLDTAFHPAKTEPIGTVIQAHGITVDKDEGGMFVRLAEALSGRGFNVIRFSYRGHGKSGGTPLGVTVTGEIIDLRSVIEHSLGRWPEPLSVLAASFGAVSSSLLLPMLEDRIDSLVLWNPVLDLEHTFLNPELPWGMENFGPEQQRKLDTSGRLLIDGEFPLSPIMWREFSLYDPFSAYTSSQVPSLVVHGDQDTYVSYDIARAAVSSRIDADFHTIQGSDHGFDSTDGKMKPSEYRRTGLKLGRSESDGSEELARTRQGPRGPPHRCTVHDRCAQGSPLACLPTGRTRKTRLPGPHRRRLSDPEPGRRIRGRGMY